MSQHTDLTSLVNIVFLLIFLLFTILVRYSHASSWFICPIMTIYLYYYASFVKLEPDNVTYIFCMPIGISSAFFLLCIFNEVWLISTATFAPLIAFTIWQAGANMKGSETGNELILRVFWCIVCYAVVGYTIEKNQKLAFIGSNKEN